MIRWHLIVDGPKNGSFNMDFDLKLAENCLPNEAFFRLYRWSPFTVSLGANQSEAEIDLDALDKDKIDLVRRPTGGRAVLHSEELTYSVILPAESNIFPKDIYRKVSGALLEGLKNYDARLNGLELETNTPDFRSELAKAAGSLCFSTSARSEIKFKGRKLVGSAQKKLSRSILQHGSILCGTFHRRLPNYLKADDKVKKELKDEIKLRTIEISSILSDRVDYGRLAESLAAGFESYWDIKFSRVSNSGIKYE